MIDDECGAVGGTIIGRGNRSTRRKLAPVPLCPPKIPHDLTWVRNRAIAVGSRRLKAVAMKSAVFWVVTPCSWEAARYFGETYRFHLKRKKPAEASNKLRLHFDLKDEGGIFLRINGLCTKNTALQLRIL
jgi:hypothetical protein